MRTKSAFEKLDEINGTFDKGSEEKNGHVLTRTKMVNANLVKLIKKEVQRAVMKKNLLKNLNVMLMLNIYDATAKRMALLAEAERIKAKKEKLEKKRPKIIKEKASAIETAGNAWYKTMISDNDFIEFDVFSKWLVGCLPVEESSSCCL